MLVFRDHGTREDRQKTRLMWLVEQLGNEAFTKLVSDQMGGAEFGPHVDPGYTDVWKRRDVLGVHPQKQEGLSWVRAAAFDACLAFFSTKSLPIAPCCLRPAVRAVLAAQGPCDRCASVTLAPLMWRARTLEARCVQVGACVPAGRLQTDDFDALADVADRFSGGEVRITCEENVIFPNVKNEDIEALRKEPLFERFEIDAGNIMRGLVSCTGSQFCGFGLVETKNRCAHSRVHPRRRFHPHAKFCAVHARCDRAC